MERQVAGGVRMPIFQFERTKWSIFGILILTYILVYFHRMAPGVVSEFLMADFQTKGARLSYLSAIYFFCLCFHADTIWGYCRHFGHEDFLCFRESDCWDGFPLFRPSGIFLDSCVGRFLVGLGVSVVFVSIMKSNSVWFHEKVFGIMSGLTLLFGNLGSVLAAGPLATILTAFAWRTVFIGIGCISLSLALLGYFLSRTDPKK